MARQITIFDNMEFPDYRFREYPKMVYPPGGPVYAPAAKEGETPDQYAVTDANRHMVGKPIGFLVHSEDEELELMDASPEEMDSVGLSALRSRAEQLMIPVDGRWGIPRLRAEIARAEAA